MTHLTQADDLFFSFSEMDKDRVQRLVDDSLHGLEDGELFLEYSQSEHLSFDDGQLKQASFNTGQGFGLRGLLGEVTGYAHASELSEEALKRAAQTVRAVTRGHSGTIELSAPPPGTNRLLYDDANPIPAIPFEQKVKFLTDVDRWLRDKDPHVAQVSVNLANSWQVVEIIRPDGHRAADIRPLVRLDISVVVEKDGRMERSSQGTGGRMELAPLLEPAAWQAQALEALRQALVNLDSIPAPAGEMTVVLGPGWPGVLLHEAVGHGLEGDFNRKKTSAFAGLLGQRVASPGVTVVDDGTIEGRRGSLTIDDEGTPSQCTTLIEDGILVGYMQDRLNARLMGVPATGNGRRESFAHAPLPRMTNTFMRPGDQDPQEIISSVKNGLYAVNFGGGQVDITSGKFVFSASEAYRIEDGKLTAPVKGATLIGNGPDVLTRVSAIGNDLELDRGVGTCGKAGQGVPVGVGQPTLRIDGLTVGGTQV